MSLTRLQHRRGLSSEWVAGNPVLAPGEIGLELNTGKFKIGNGLTAWNTLEYGLASAFDVAVKNGFEGTEQQWLDSLVGPEGSEGAPGAPGVDGADGSTYLVSSLIPSTSYTIGVVNQQALLRFTASSGVALTIPNNSTQPIAIGTSITFVQMSSGKITVSGASGVTVRTTTTNKSRSQNSIITAIKIDTNDWILGGDLDVF